MAHDALVESQSIESIRHFNRFYTRLLGLLDEGLLKSEVSLSEARVLYELAHRDGLTASQLCRELGLDPGYLSRILKQFEARGMLIREPSTDDARQVALTLSGAGRAGFELLNRASHEQIAALIGGLGVNERSELLKAMRTVEMLLGERPGPAVPYILRPHHIGDMGWIAHRQGILYNLEYGWDETFEALVAEIAGTFVKNFNPRRERCWIAERDGEVVGSVFLVSQSDTVGKLRLLYVEPAARGLGIGRRLVDECIRTALEKHYKTLTLWTNDVLVSARRIYQAAGFKLIEEERHHSFGKDLVGQNWSLEL
jgi:DNA-binding MarR family transcriptional regulator/N-acetylglutamate synthase-like GNAT family acetyltransferase